MYLRTYPSLYKIYKILHRYILSMPRKLNTIYLQIQLINTNYVRAYIELKRRREQFFVFDDEIFARCHVQNSIESKLKAIFSESRVLTRVQISKVISTVWRKKILYIFYTSTIAIKCALLESYTRLLFYV